jgi:hypothetical protein
VPDASHGHDGHVHHDDGHLHDVHRDGAVPR